MTSSQTIGKLAEALCKAQADMKPAVKEAENPFFHSSYADLATVSKAVFPVLTKHGLSISQITEGEGSVTTILMHTSGEWISGTLSLKPVKVDPQGIGSAITYARRYALSAICGLATEDDDDGNAGSEKPRVQAKAVAPTPSPEPEKPRLSIEQIQLIDIEEQNLDNAKTYDDLKKINESVMNSDLPEDIKAIFRTKLNTKNQSLKPKGGKK